MAVSTNSYFNNAIVGTPQVGVNVDVFGKHSTPQFAVGTKFERQDGSVFRYAHFGADVNRGVLVAVDASESSAADTDNAIVAPASAQTTSDGTIGSKFIEITLASVTADQFAGGYFITTDDTGEGYTYRVKGNTATDNPASGNIRLEIYEKLQVAVDATTDFIIQGSPYANLEIATNGTDNVLAGVTVSTMDVSEQAYGWVLTHGVVGILTDDSVPAAGDIAALSDTDNGAVGTLGNGGTDVTDVIGEQIVGTCLVAADDTGHGAYKVAI